MALTEEEKVVLEIAKQRGRYKGWMLINDRFIRKKTDACRPYINGHGLSFVHWSSLSGDSDDENDFAIGKDRYW